ncbi:hypothetical protein CDEST_13125 [Colletotrichum destructivum]|uniref:Small secreted protein n=1 Tax=Colletotrichum destructivum TaxID=34406 RepID=A0AAX4IY62_9PEZI|nr:hypothetical protein CDEST_13125 [Colletotrichum destructivum]
MKFLALILFPFGLAAALSTEDKPTLAPTLESRQSTQKCCVAFVAHGYKGQSRSGDLFRIEYEWGGVTSRGLFPGCNLKIDRKRAAPPGGCSEWTFSAEGGNCQSFTTRRVGPCT